jgi:hypothetical protein
MFGSSILEVAIGLAFIYLLLSLICTAANELVAALIRMRAINLEKGIRNLLNDPSGNALAKKFYEHPLIKGLYRDEKRKPSYIPPRTFALALMDIVMPIDHPRPKTMKEICKVITDAKGINPQVQKALLILIEDAGSNLDKRVTDFNKVLNNIEMWFNTSMERVAGWYKRKTQLIVFMLAILFTFAMNIDTISISKSLSNNSALRASVVAAAQEAARQPSFLIPAGQAKPQVTDTETSGDKIQPPTKNLEDIYGNLKKQVDELEQLGISIGWDIPLPGSQFSIPQKIGWWVTKFLGLMLTVFAASLGAPFWFDILNKIISIRSAGKLPKEAPEPEKILTPTSSP